MTDIKESKIYQFRNSKANKAIVIVNIILIVLTVALSFVALFGLFISIAGAMWHSTIAYNSPLSYFMEPEDTTTLYFESYDEDTISYSYIVHCSLNSEKTIYGTGLVGILVDGVELTESDGEYLIPAGTHTYTLKYKESSPIVNDKKTSLFEFKTNADEIEYSSDFKTFSDSDLKNTTKRLYTKDAKEEYKGSVFSSFYLVYVYVLLITIVYSILDIGKAIVFAVIISKKKKQIEANIPIS